MASGIIYFNGKLTMTPVGGGAEIELAEVKNVSVEQRDTKVVADGTGFYPLDVRIKDKQVSIRAQWLKWTQAGLAAITGGVKTTGAGGDAGFDVISVTNTSDAGYFRLTLQTPNAGTDMKIRFTNVKPANFTIPLAAKEFSQPNCEFDVMADANGNVYEILIPTV